MDLYIVTICVGIWLLTLFITKVFGFFGKRPRYPPGPIGLPIFGYMPFFAYKPLQKLQDLSSKYGEICTIYLGQYRVVMLNSHEVIRKAFKEDAFSGRPCLKMLEVRNGGIQKGLVCSEGKHWNEQRKFTLKHLRDLGMGKRSMMEGFIQEELTELISSLNKEIGKPVNLQNRFNLAVLNALWRIICGQRYKHDDPRLQCVLQKTSADLAETQYTGPLLFLPWMVKFAPGLTRWNEFINSVNSVHAFLKEIIEEHKRDEGSILGRDFVHDYLTEIRNATDTESSFYKEEGEHSLLVVLLDLFMAGGDTTSTTLYWTFLYMAKYPKVQVKVQEEIDFVLGSSSPSLENRQHMPYTEATICEVLRKSSLVPMGLFHSTTCDTQLLGYDIPKDTVIMANLFSLNFSKKYWRDPELFRPSRFLSVDQSAVIKYDALLSFSTGKRVCPGENLAKDQIFLFLIGLLQKFTFMSDPSQPILSEEPRNGVILSPQPYSIIVKERF